MPVAPSSDFLTQKAGILPVWGWGAIGLGAAYGYSRYKANQAAAQGNGTTGTTNAAGESTAAAPQFIIENNEPGWGSVSVPVTVNNPAPVPVTTPPGTGTGPPVTIQGGNPPHRPGPPLPVGGPTPPANPKPPPPGKPAPKAPVAYKVQHGDNLSTIAAKYHTTWQALWSFNTGAQSPHSAQARAELLKQGPNRIYSGQTIYIPQ